MLAESGSNARPSFDALNTVVEGDCLDVLPELPDASVDMVLCDLPYGSTRNPWDSVIPLERLWEQYWRVLKPNGVAVLMAQGVFSARLIVSMERYYKYKIVWEKSKATNFLNARKQPLRKHEDICVFYRKQPTFHPQMWQGAAYNKGVRKDQGTGCYDGFGAVEVKSDGRRYPTDIVYFKTAETEGPVHHPSQKPVALGRYLVRTYTNSGDVVLDNACGSGSFLVAAALEGRNFVGIEKNDGVMSHRDGKLDCVSLARERVAAVVRGNGVR